MTRAYTYLTAGNYRLDVPASLSPGPVVLTGRATPSSGTIDISTGFAFVLAFVGCYSETGGTAEILWTIPADSDVADTDRKTGVIRMTGSDKEISFIAIGLI